MDLTIVERNEVSAFINEMSDVADIITKLRTENEQLKKQLAKETAAKKAAIHREQKEIVRRKESEKQLEAMKDRVEELEDEKEELEEDKKELEEENEEHMLVIKDVKINLKDTNEKLKRCQEEVFIWADKLHESVKLVAETDHQREIVERHNKSLSTEAEHQMKYRKNYNDRNNLSGLIMEDLAQLEELITQFSFFRRRSDKRLCLNRIREKLQKSMSSYIQ